MYYTYIENNGINGIGQCECLNEEIQNIEITEEVYNNIDRYIWNGTEIILDPDYDEKQKQKERQAKNKEIDSKIKELREMSLIDIMNNNKENIQIYNDVITGLEVARPLI